MSLAKQSDIHPLEDFLDIPQGGHRDGYTRPRLQPSDPHPVRSTDFVIGEVLSQFTLDLDTLEITNMIKPEEQK